MARHLLNRAAVRDYILDQVRDMRPGWECTRVAASAYPEIEAILRRRLKDAIHRHPSGCGKTFRMS